MDSHDVLAALEGALLARYPETPVFWNRLPKDFVRPCFTLECQKVTQTDANRLLIQREAQALVTCYTAVDAYGDCDRGELTRRQDEVLGLLSQGGLSVGDRFVSVQAVQAAQSPDYSEVSAVFSWMDARPDYCDPEEHVPVMEQYELNETELK